VRRLPALLLVLALFGCGGSGSEDPLLVAYSTPKEAYEELIPAFQRTAQGRGVSFDRSYGSSGDQSRAVRSGLPADVVALSLAPDTDKLVGRGLVDARWSEDEHRGFVTSSVVVLTTRAGNPKDIRTWEDLARPGVEVLTPNPFTSGGARWNLMAAYGAQVRAGRSKPEALAFLEAVLENTVVQDKSARESLQTFAGGKGDVLIAYENEAITARAQGVELDYVVPDATILIENPIAATTKASAPARAFVRWTRSQEAQRIFAAKGYRSVLPELVDERRFPTPPGLFTIGDLGGWDAVMREFFDPEKGAVAGLERDLGVSTAR